MKPINETSQDASENSSDKPLRVNLTLHFTPKWAVMIGILAIGVLYLLLPDEYTIGPSWLLLAVIGVLLLPYIISSLTHYHLPHTTARLIALVILGLVTLALVSGVTLLIVTLPSRRGSTLLYSAVILWSLNILVFALWYWEIDCGGPIKRHMSGHQAVDFLFPQQVDGNPKGWVPLFVDYLFLAFNTSTALSPADTYPLTRRAKGLMMIQAVISLSIIVFLAARAVNILQ